MFDNVQDDTLLTILSLEILYWPWPAIYECIEQKSDLSTIEQSNAMLNLQGHSNKKVLSLLLDVKKLHLKWSLMEHQSDLSRYIHVFWGNYHVCHIHV